MKGPGVFNLVLNEPTFVVLRQKYILLATMQTETTAQGDYRTILAQIHQEMWRGADGDRTKAARGVDPPISRQESIERRELEGLIGLEKEASRD
jgi:hypothetical protein